MGFIIGQKIRFVKNLGLKGGYEKTDYYHGDGFQKSDKNYSREIISIDGDQINVEDSERKVSSDCKGGQRRRL